MGEKNRDVDEFDKMARSERRKRKGEDIQMREESRDRDEGEQEGELESSIIVDKTG